MTSNYDFLLHSDSSEKKLKGIHFSLQDRILDSLPSVMYHLGAFCVPPEARAPHRKMLPYAADAGMGSS